MGVRARRFPGIRWDFLWEQPLAHVRRELDIVLDGGRDAAAFSVEALPNRELQAVGH